MKKNLFLISLLLLCCHFLPAQDDFNPRAFISISGTFGKHSISFKNDAKSPGFSFGYSVSAGIYALQRGDYRAGLMLTLLEGASRNRKRRQLSEDFELPFPQYDKHHLFNFAQFRAANIGWFQELDLGEEVSIYHQIGFGIFGTTELDQLLDFGLSNQLGFLLGGKDSFRGRLGLNLDTSFGTGNPNYKQSNLGITFGGFRAW